MLTIEFPDFVRALLYPFPSGLYSDGYMQDIVTIFADFVDTDSVCVFLCKYSIFYFSGSVEMYSMDESIGTWSLSHTLKFSRSQFPGTSGG